MKIFERFSHKGLLVAHRGARAIRPENTPCAFAAALGRCDLMEFDIRLSRDHQAVVIHDASLGRTSNAASLIAQDPERSLSVEAWTLAELQRLDMGSWFLRDDPFGTIKQGLVLPETLKPLMPQPILTFEELLRWAKTHNLPVNLEIKKSQDPRIPERLVEVVVSVIRKVGYVGQVLVSSFVHEYLLRCRQLLPELATAALQEDFHPPDLPGYLKHLGVCAYHPEDRLVDQGLVSSLDPLGYHVNVFTVNDGGRQRQLYSWGVTAIFSDFLKEETNRSP